MTISTDIPFGGTMCTKMVTKNRSWSSTAKTDRNEQKNGTQSGKESIFAFVFGFHISCSFK